MHISSALILLLLVIKVQSNYYVYTYDHGDDDEHCCLVRIGEQFCLGKPLTRSLIQVKKDCQRFEANDKKKDYLKKIIRRLNVERSDKVGEKILIQLKDPLEKVFLNNDLLCLSTTTNHIDLEKCFVKLDRKEKKKSKENDSADDDDQSDEIEVNEPVQVRQGHGLTVRQVYELNLTDFRATTSQQRTCWSWYRQHTKNILSHPNKLQKSCIPFSRKQDKCLRTLFNKKTEEDNRNDTVSSGSKLYCENDQGQTKLLGYLRRSEICFITHYQIYLEHHFTDFLSLTDRKKNQDVLRFISNNTKLASEFETDCRDKDTLDQIKKLAEEKAKAKAEAKEKEEEEEEEEQNSATTKQSPISTEL